MHETDLGWFDAGRFGSCESRSVNCSDPRLVARPLAAQQHAACLLENPSHAGRNFAAQTNPAALDLVGNSARWRRVSGCRSC
ncbi:MAG TPA: hypothetical protein VGI86_05460 [Acidimicrobiia bacterium]